MAGKFSIFNSEYLGRAKPKQVEQISFAEMKALEKKMKTCKACGQAFVDGDFIHIQKDVNGIKRRHLRCAEEKNVIGQEEAERIREILNQRNLTRQCTGKKFSPDHLEKLRLAWLARKEISYPNVI